MKGVWLLILLTNLIPSKPIVSKLSRIVKISLSLLFAANCLPSLASQIYPVAPSIGAKAYLLVDFLSKQTLVAHNSEQALEPASLTKMMSVYVVDQEIKSNRLKLDDLVLISENAWKMSGSRMFLKLGSRVKVRDLVKGIIIQSGNDACVALAEWIAGSEDAFVDMMNAHAKALKMHNTHFHNATGMPHPQHLSTAKDLSLLASALIRDFPETYRIYAEKDFKFNNIKQNNRNQLLWRNDLVDGIKTGHTDSAGFCMVASGKTDKMRLIAVVMGTKSENQRAVETNKLLSYGFRSFETYQLYRQAEALQTPRVWLGQEKTLAVGLEEDLNITIQKGAYSNLKAHVELDSPLRAPIKQGQILGRLRINLSDQVIKETPIVALQTLPTAGWFRYGLDFLALHWQKLWQAMFK